jgi:hypothetical protein
LLFILLQTIGTQPNSNISTERPAEIVYPISAITGSTVATAQGRTQ